MNRSSLGTQQGRGKPCTCAKALRWGGVCWAEGTRRSLWADTEWKEEMGEALGGASRQ